MNKKVRDIAKTIVVSLIILIVIGWFISRFVSNRHERLEREKKEEEKRLSIEKNLKEMIVKWNAVVDWDKQLNRNLIFEFILTAELQDILIREDKRPVLFFLYLKDVVKKDNNSYVAYFDRTHLLEPPSVNFVVNCNNGQYKHIILKPPNKYFRTKFALIVKVRDVCSSPFFYSENYNGENYIDTGLIPTVIGDCLDIVRIGLYDREKLDLEQFSEGKEK